MFPGLGNGFCSHSELQVRNWSHSHRAENPIFLLPEISDQWLRKPPEQQQDVIPVWKSLARCSWSPQVALQWAQPPESSVCSSRAGDAEPVQSVWGSWGTATNGMPKEGMQPETALTHCLILLYPSWGYFQWIWVRTNSCCEQLQNSGFFITQNPGEMAGGFQECKWNMNKQSFVVTSTKP